jgi:excisionase family DNA binding protein
MLSYEYLYVLRRRVEEDLDGMNAILDAEYVTVAEAAALLKVHKSTIRRWIDRGELPAYRVGRRRVALKRTDLARMITALPRTEDWGGGIASPEFEVTHRLSPEQQQRGFQVLAELRRLHEQVRAELGDAPLEPSWEILAELRDERSRQLP